MSKIKRYLEDLKEAGFEEEELMKGLDYEEAESECQ